MYPCLLLRMVHSTTKHKKHKQKKNKYFFCLAYAYTMPFDVSLHLGMCLRSTWLLAFSKFEIRRRSAQSTFYADYWFFMLFYLFASRGKRCRCRECIDAIMSPPAKVHSIVSIVFRCLMKANGCHLFRHRRRQHCTTHTCVHRKRADVFVYTGPVCFTRTLAHLKQYHICKTCVNEHCSDMCLCTSSAYVKCVYVYVRLARSLWTKIESKCT